MKHRYYLRIGSDSIDEAIKCRSLHAATVCYAHVARELACYGQSIDATVHKVDLGPRGGASAIEEDPDYVLSLGPRGGVKVERT
jgi:hypothetical protein